VGSSDWGEDLELVFHGDSFSLGRWNILEMDGCDG
jgi:hypothetical protein